MSAACCHDLGLTMRRTGTSRAFGSSNFRCFAGGTKKESIVLFLDILFVNDGLEKKETLKLMTVLK
jgi:hypothetical protein